MIKMVIEISLALLLALPLHVFSAQEGQDNKARKAAVMAQSLRNLSEQIRLGRSVVEFAEEFSMFDTQLYGSLPDKGSSREQMLELGEEIRSTNSKLGQALVKMNDVANGIGGSYDGGREVTPQEVAAEVSRLENQLAAMNDRMGELHNQTVLDGDSELLDGSLWDGLLNTGSTRELLDMIDESLAAEALGAKTESTAPDDKQ